MRPFDGIGGESIRTLLCRGYRIEPHLVGIARWAEVYYLASAEPDPDAIGVVEANDGTESALRREELVQALEDVHDFPSIGAAGQRVVIESSAVCATTKRRRVTAGIPASRRRSCVRYDFTFHQVVKGTFTLDLSNMLDTQKST